MANFNFNLRDPKAEKPTPIYLIIRYSNKRVKFYTRESITPKYWDFEDQKAKQTKQFSEYPEFNHRLSSMKSTAKDVFRRYQNDHNHEEPSPAELKRLLETEIKGTKGTIPTSFIEFTEYFIEETRKKLRTEKKEYPRNDIASAYAQALACIKDFAKDKNKRIDFDTIDNDFYNEFVKYLRTVKTVKNKRGKNVNKYGFKDNTIGKHIKNLKRILNEASLPEVNVNKFTYYERFKVLQEDTDAIYLNEKEIQSMYDLDLSDKPHLDRVRDLFLVGAWTGLRFSDFSKIQAKNIKGEYIHIQTQKTGQKVVIPIHWMVKAIIEKYKDQFENSLPPEISNAKMNAYLKEIGRKMDKLKVKESVKYTKAGKTVIKQEEKCELLSTHTARRSFATNMYKRNVPVIAIMGVTGHRTEKAFLRYIKVTPDEHAKIIMSYFKDQNNLQVV
jgi:integrase